MKEEDLPFPPARFPWPSNEQMRANDAYRDPLLHPEVATEKALQLRELCEELRVALQRAQATQGNEPG